MQLSNGMVVKSFIPPPRSVGFPTACPTLARLLSSCPNQIASRAPTSRQISHPLFSSRYHFSIPPPHPRSSRWLLPAAHRRSSIDPNTSVFLQPYQRAALRVATTTMADGSGACDAAANAQLLRELDALSHSLYQSHITRRTASLILPRSSTPAAPDAGGDASRSQSRPRSRRMSMSPWRSRPKSQNEPHDDDSGDRRRPPPPSRHQSQQPVAAETADRKGIWNWKPVRALSHIAMQRLGCLFSVEVLAVQGLPNSMNGLRLSVTVRKKETKEGALRATPARVTRGSAEFEETLFIRCHAYCTGGAGTGKPIKFESRPFLISTVAIDAPELDLGRSSVDLSQLIKESMERGLEGADARQWDAKFPLSGKGRGGELLVKLSFQITEDASVGLFKQDGGGGSSSKFKDSSYSFARKKSKSSFAVMSPKITRADPSLSPREEPPAINSKEIETFSLDDVPPPPPPLPPSPPPAKKPGPEPKDDVDLLEFEVVERGVELQAEKEEHSEIEEQKEQEADSAEVAEEPSASKEVVKQVVHDSTQLTQLTELDAITQQIEAVESKMIGDEPSANESAQEEEIKLLDAEEDAVTREFLKMLQLDENARETQMLDISDHSTPIPGAEDGEKGTYISDLGKGLGSVIQTRDGGYLSAMNPFDVHVARKDTPKLAMQISKPFILGNQNLTSGLEVFQRLAAAGSEELGARLHSLTSMDELMGKTAEQIAFEGMASAITSGRNTEVTSSGAAETVTLLKTMAAALSEERKHRILTGIWNVKGDPLTAEDILPFALQKIEAMAVEALRIQAGMAEEDAPFSAPLLTRADNKHPLDSAIPPENWDAACAEANSVTLAMIVQLREPLRRYETVGAPSIVVIQAERAGGGEEAKFKVASLHVGGLKLRPGGRRPSIWDGEKQRLTAAQWLTAYGGLGKAAKKKEGQSKGEQDVLWSMSSRILADMWLKPMRNPDIKIT